MSQQINVKSLILEKIHGDSQSHVTIVISGFLS